LAEAGAEEGAGFRGLGKPNEENPALKLGDVFLPTALLSYTRPPVMTEDHVEGI
jgi:hypothetical protein